MDKEQRVRLADLIDIKHGFAFQGEFFSSNGPGDLLVTPGNFAIGGGFQWGKAKFYNGPIPKDYILEAGDLIVSMTDLSKEADTLGYSAIVPKCDKRLLHNQRIGKIIRRRKDTNLHFIYWVMRSQEYRNEVLASFTGSTVKHTSPTRILAFEFLLPPRHEQTAIAAVLDALDDKIDLNRCMNETMETMARAIFKDWFVDFGPTRAKMEGRTPYLSSDVWALFPERLDDEGKPVDWQSSVLTEEFRLVMGQSPPGETYNQNGDGLLFFQGRTDFGWRYPQQRVFCTAPSRFAETDDTLVSVRAPVGDLNMAWEHCAIGRGVAAVRHRGGHRGYTYYTLSHIQPLLAAFEHEGTVFGAINKIQFEALPVIVPPSAVVQAFENVANMFDDTIRVNISETETLAATRDLLLPKLMSGEIRIKDAEKIVETVL